MYIHESNQPDEDINDLPAGSEVDEDVVDDAERDEAAAIADAEAKQPLDRDSVLADMQAAMGETVDLSDTEPVVKPKDEAKPVEKPDDKPAAKPIDEQDGQQTDEQKALEAATAEAEAARVAEVDKEADTLKLKGKTRERFHELSREVSERDAKIKAYEELGPDPANLAAAIKDHEQFQDAIFSTGLTSDDFKNVAGYKAAINSKDPAAWENARQFLTKELAWLETDLMGVRAPEGKTLLDGHEDLKTKVERGELGMEDAEEIAAGRNSRTKLQEVSGKQTVAEQQEAAASAGTEACADYATKIAAADAAQWQAKWPVLKPKLAEIQEKFPPDQWQDRMELEYNRIAYAPAAAAKPAQPAATHRPGTLPRHGGARRPGGADPGTMRKDESDLTPLQALRVGMGQDPGAPEA